MKPKNRKNKAMVLRRSVALAVALLVAMALAVPQGSSLAMAAEITPLAEGGTVEIADADSLSSALASTGSNGEILKLTADIPTTATLTVTSGVDVTLDLNGHSITNDGSSSVITVNSGGTLTLTDSSTGGTGMVTGGSAPSGGGVYVTGSFVMTGGTVSGNTATGSNSTDVVTGGGGVYVTNGGSFTMTGGAVSGNTVKAADGAAVTGGGGICAVINTTVTLSDCEVSYNAAYSAVGGGGIYTRGTLELGAGTRVCANCLTAQTYGSNGDGGGIYTTIANSSITIHRGVTISGNQCEGAGGGFYCYNGTVTVGAADESAPNAGNTQIIGNTSMHMGGGIGANNGTVTLTDTEIYGNRTVGSSVEESDSTGSHGGGVYVYNNGSITVNEGTKIGDSGTVSVEVPVVDNGSVTGYTTETKSKGNYAEEDGGGVYVASGSLSITGGDIQYNEAGVNGGGVYNADTALIISGGTISFNTAGASGGGVYSHAETEVQNCVISYNSAALDGGGVYSEAKTSLNQDSRVLYNTAGRNGGGLYDGGGNPDDAGEEDATTLSYCYVQGNEAQGIAATEEEEGTGNGGGIYTHHQTDVSFAYIYSNKAAQDGGGVYSNAATTMTRTQTMYNEAGNDGGGIYSHGDTTVSESHVSSNAASGDGGGLYSAADTTITNTEIQDNCTAGNGGGIYIDNSKLILTTDSASGVLDGFPTMTSSDITGNRAGYDNSEKQEWIADKNSHGGGVYIEPPASGRAAAGEFDVSGSVTVKNNEASSGTENVWLFTDTADQTITIVSPGLTSAAGSIGVSTEETPTVTSDVQFTTDEAAAGTSFYTDHATYFFSDKGYGIRADTDDPDGEEGEYLELYLNPDDEENSEEETTPGGGSGEETTPGGGSEEETTAGTGSDAGMAGDAFDEMTVSDPSGSSENSGTSAVSLSGAKTNDVSAAGWRMLLFLSGALLAVGLVFRRHRI